MTDTNFFNQELIKNHLLFSIYDVDEFVLREVERIKSSNTIDIWDVSKAKRYSFEIHQVGKDKYEEDEISTEDYLYQRQLVSRPEIWLQVKIEFTLIIYIPYLEF
ncbi:hypothetical protein PL373_03710 [Tenacibaculum maritimum]|nr:hypothetical protein [Tenacibaculum maritimum]MDB0600260.1 hypothetical protein [Tenacibaculum maritimum]